MRPNFVSSAAAMDSVLIDARNASAFWYAISTPFVLQMNRSTPSGIRAGPPLLAAVSLLQGKDWTNRWIPGPAYAGMTFFQFNLF